MIIVKNINEKTLLENGYREWENSGIMNKHSKRFFQKRFRNTKGKTMFFITIYEYGLGENIYNVELQFEKEKYTMNIDLFGINEDLTLEQLENEVYKIWFKLKCEYYE